MESEKSRKEEIKKGEKEREAEKKKQDAARKKEETVRKKEEDLKKLSQENNPEEKSESVLSPPNQGKTKDKNSFRNAIKNNTPHAIKEQHRNCLVLTNSMTA